MTDTGFTIPEFIELLVSSLLGGAITGTILVFLYFRFRKRKSRRQQLYDEERQQNGAEENNIFSTCQDSDRIIVIHAQMMKSRQTPSIPIQDPPDEENSAFWNGGSNDGVRNEEGIVHHDCVEDGVESEGRKMPKVPLASSPPPGPSAGVVFLSVRPDSDHGNTYTYPPRTRQPSPAPTTRYSQFNRSIFKGLNSNSPRCSMSNQAQEGDGATNSTAEAPLSRTATNMSNLPLYDTLSSGPPRYSSRSKTISSPSVSVRVSGDQPSPAGPYPPMPVDKWWAKQDGSDMF
jgi:hypothetical protein